MPGIVGIVSGKPAHECEPLVARMLASMQHETSYVSGKLFAAETGIYAGWVAHENSFAASQLFFCEERDIAICLAGECFVNTDDAALLRRRGYKIDPSDGSWMALLYAELGESFVEHLNGLFSGLVVDKRQKRAYLFNDRYRMERIYWHQSKDTFYFASEAKALLEILPELRAFDVTGVAEFLCYGCTLNSRTIFKGIELLPEGSSWLFEGNRVSRRKYFDPQTWEAQDTLPEQSFEQEFSSTLRQIIPRYFTSATKVGVSLTGGLDSRIIMASMGQVSPAPICYTFSGQNRDLLDARVAAQVATACGLEHRVLRLGDDFFSDFSSHADRTIYLTDGTLGPIGAHEIYFNSQARLLAPVRLTGVFGGEIMRGVSFFKPVGMSTTFLSADLQQQIASVRHEKARNGQHPVTFAAFNEVPQRRFGVPAAARSQVVFRTPYLDNDFVALAYRAPRGSTALAAENALRFVQQNNAALASISTDRGYLNGRRSFPRKAFTELMFKLDYFYSEGLPLGASRIDPFFRRVMSTLGVSGRYKFLYYRTWFQRELASYWQERLRSSFLRQSSLWKTDALVGIAEEHRLGRANRLQELNAVLTLEAVERLLFKASWNSGKSAPFASQTTASASR
jgi:asparagine synthase (glutamine-hydrolysing)